MATWSLVAVPGCPDGAEAAYPGSLSWQPIPLPTPRGTSFVRALTQDNAGVIFAGTEGDGVFASFDEGITWQTTNDGLTVNRVFALGLDSQGHIVAGTSAGVFRGVTWPTPKQKGDKQG